MEKGFLSISVIHARGFSNSIVFSFSDISNISQNRLLELNLAWAFILLQTGTFCVHVHACMCGDDDVLGRGVETRTRQKREQDDV